MNCSLSRRRCSSSWAMSFGCNGKCRKPSPATAARCNSSRATARRYRGPGSPASVDMPLAGTARSPDRAAADRGRRRGRSGSCHGGAATPVPHPAGSHHGGAASSAVPGSGCTVASSRPRPPASRRRGVRRTRSRRLPSVIFPATFHAHATAWLTAELFEKHDRERLEIFGYSYGPDDGSPMRRRFANAFDRFVD